MEVFKVQGVIDLKDNLTNKIPGVKSKMDEVDKKSGSLRSGFSKLGAVLGGVVVASLAGFGAILVSGAKDAMEAEARVAQLDAVLKSTGGSAGMTKDSLLTLADGFEKTTKFSAEAALEAQALLLTFTNIGKDTFPRATKAAADMATAMGTDMAGQSIALGKALNDPIKGISALSRVGVTFTKQQQKQIKTMQAAGDMAGAQTVILKELEKEFGGSAEAAGQTFAGQLEILKNAFGNVKEELATQFMPYLKKFMDWVMANMPAIQAGFQTAFDVISRVAKVLGNTFTTYVLPALITLYDWVQTNMPLIKQFIADMVDMVVPKFKKIVDIVKDIADNIFPAMKKGSTDLRDTVKSLTKTGLDNLITALTWIKNNTPLVKGALVALTAAWVIHKGVVLAHNIALGVNNGLMFLAAVRSKAETVAIVALYVAQGISTAAIKVASIAQAAFNLVMSLNPIGIVIIALAALGIGIYALVKNWDTVTGAIKKAWDWLNKWNKTDVKTKAIAASTPSSKTGSGGGYSGGTSNGGGAHGGGSGFAVGSRYLPYDMIAPVHKGEMIVPESENPYANSGGKILPQGLNESYFTRKGESQSAKAVTVNNYITVEKMDSNRDIDDIGDKLGNRTYEKLFAIGLA